MLDVTRNKMATRQMDVLTLRNTGMLSLLVIIITSTHGKSHVYIDVDCFLCLSNITKIPLDKFWWNFHDGLE